MLLAEIVETSAAVGGTAARSEKIDSLAATLKRVEPQEASIAAAYLSSQLRQRQIGVGYASMRDLPEPAEAPTLTLREVDAALEAIGALAGKDSQAERRRMLQQLLARATGEEQHFLVQADHRRAAPGCARRCDARGARPRAGRARRRRTPRGDAARRPATRLPKPPCATDQPA